MNGKSKDIRALIVISSALFLCLFLWAKPGASQAETPSFNTPEAGSIKLLEDRDYFPVLMKTINDAKHEIIMSFFMFKTNGYSDSYTDRVLAALVRAAGRGVKIRVTLEKGDVTKDSQAYKSNLETAARLTAKGVEVRFDSPRTTTHTKVAVIDRRYVFLGSHNLTNSALRYNHELSVFIDSTSMAMETLRYINSLH